MNLYLNPKTNLLSTFQAFTATNHLLPVTTATMKKKQKQNVAEVATSQAFGVTKCVQMTIKHSFGKGSTGKEIISLREIIGLAAVQLKNTF